MKGIMYYHGGSGNRGCEAIVRSTNKILKNAGFTDVIVYSSNPSEDYSVHLEDAVAIEKICDKKIEDVHVLLRAVAKLYNKTFKSEYIYYLLTAGRFRKIDFKGNVALSVGGDHYCYAGGEQLLALHNREVKKNHGFSVLWGCSVEPELLTPMVVEDMKRYDAIFARESLTYNALKEKNLQNVFLYPDPAFTLDYKETDFSRKMNQNTIGINISTYAINGNDLGLKNYIELIGWLQDNTDMDICLIPHVFKSHTNDMKSNKTLYEALPNKDRVHLVDKEYSAEEMKGIIRKCRLFVGARTHSTIAAYSSCVPTVVVGYSVKALGIAQDIMGDNENYVIPVQDMNSQYSLTEKVKSLIDNESKLRNHLHFVMPDYIRRSYDAGCKLMSLAKEIMRLL